VHNSVFWTTRPTSSAPSQLATSCQVAGGTIEHECDGPRQAPPAQCTGLSRSPTVFPQLSTFSTLLYLVGRIFNLLLMRNASQPCRLPSNASEGLAMCLRVLSLAGHPASWINSPPCRYPCVYLSRLHNLVRQELIHHNFQMARAAALLCALAHAASAGWARCG
jgi:hypothetical protein